MDPREKSLKRKQHASLQRGGLKHRAGGQLAKAADTVIKTLPQHLQQQHQASSGRWQPAASPLLTLGCSNPRWVPARSVRHHPWLFWDWTAPGPSFSFRPRTEFPGNHLFQLRGVTQAAPLPEVTKSSRRGFGAGFARQPLSSKSHTFP